jgi:hypothetical protein
MDVMTIDGSRLQIPSSGVRGKPRGRGIDIRLSSASGHRDGAHQSAKADAVVPGPCSAGPSAGVKREDIVIDVRPRGDPAVKMAGLEAQALLEIYPAVVPLGYFVFSLALALCNLLRPALTQAVCIALSPLPLLCILAHAIGIQPVWIAWALVLCGWLTPSVCALWSVVHSACFLVCLTAFAVAGCMRIAPSLCLLVVIACTPLALYPQWTGLEPKLWMTVAVFFSTLGCATAYSGGGKIIYRVTKSGA